MVIMDTTIYLNRDEYVNPRTTAKRQRFEYDVKRNPSELAVRDVLLSTLEEELRKKSETAIAQVESSVNETLALSRAGTVTLSGPASIPYHGLLHENIKNPSADSYTHNPPMARFVPYEVMSLPSYNGLSADGQQVLQQTYNTERPLDPTIRNSSTISQNVPIAPMGMLDVSAQGVGTPIEGTVRASFSALCTEVDPGAQTADTWITGTGTKFTRDLKVGDSIAICDDKVSVYNLGQYAIRGYRVTSIESDTKLRVDRPITHAHLYRGNASTKEPLTTQQVASRGYVMDSGTTEYLSNNLDFVDNNLHRATIFLTNAVNLPIQHGWTLEFRYHIGGSATYPLPLFHWTTSLTGNCANPQNDLYIWIESSTQIRMKFGTFTWTTGLGTDTTFTKDLVLSYDHYTKCMYIYQTATNVSERAVSSVVDVSTSYSPFIPPYHCFGYNAASGVNARAASIMDIRFTPHCRHIGVVTSAGDFFRGVDPTALYYFSLGCSGITNAMRDANVSLVKDHMSFYDFDHRIVKNVNNMEQPMGFKSQNHENGVRRYLGHGVLPFSSLSGTFLSQSTDTVIGQGTKFLTELVPGDIITLRGSNNKNKGSAIVRAILSDTELNVHLNDRPSQNRNRKRLPFYSQTLNLTGTYNSTFKYGPYTAVTTSTNAVVVGVDGSGFYWPDRWTLEASFYQATSAVGTRVLLEAGKAAASVRLYLDNSDTDLKLSVYGTVYSFTIASMVTNPRWRHFAIVCQGATANLYLDGTVVNHSTTIDTTPLYRVASGETIAGLVTAFECVAGAQIGNTNNFGGRVADFRFSDCQRMGDYAARNTINRYPNIPIDKNTIVYLPLVDGDPGVNVSADMTYLDPVAGDKIMKHGILLPYTTVYTYAVYNPTTKQQGVIMSTRSKPPSGNWADPLDNVPYLTSEFTKYAPLGLKFKLDANGGFQPGSYSLSRGDYFLRSQDPRLFLAGSGFAGDTLTLRLEQVVPDFANVQSLTFAYTARGTSGTATDLEIWVGFDDFLGRVEVYVPAALTSSAPPIVGEFTIPVARGRTINLRNGKAGVSIEMALVGYNL